MIDVYYLLLWITQGIRLLRSLLCLFISFKTFNISFCCYGTHIFYNFHQITYKCLALLFSNHWKSMASINPHLNFKFKALFGSNFSTPPLKICPIETSHFMDVNGPSINIIPLSKIIIVECVMYLDKPLKIQEFSMKSIEHMNYKLGRKNSDFLFNTIALGNVVTNVGWLFVYMRDCHFGF